MLIVLKSGSKLNVIGDPHIGRKFNNVPLHRVGEREKSQLATLKEQLSATDECVATICVGDLFDTFIVSNEVLIQTADAIENEYNANPEFPIIIMAGNHDVSRNSTVVSSFFILKRMLQHLSNVIFISETTEHTFFDDEILFCPYMEYEEARHEVSRFSGNHYAAVFGHWDTDPIAGPHNLIPTDLLVDMTEIVVTGHVHTNDMWEIGKTEFYCTGSMQPYSHGEDPDGTMYVTRTIEQIKEALAENPKAYHDKCLRVVIGPEEVPPVDIDCLQYTVKKIDTSEKEKLEVKMGEFSFKELFDESFRENNVPDDIREHYWAKYREKTSDDN